MDDLLNRRLKIATLNDLNDPFELLAVSLSDSTVRRAFLEMKEELSRRQGLLCFSRDWHNPVQWSHYAEKHHGLCLGFDVPDQSVSPVTYSGRRIASSIEQLSVARSVDEITTMSFLSTKFSHWIYEKEVRQFIRLDNRDVTTGLYFQAFSMRLRLREVIVGAASSITRAQVRDSLGELATSVSARKARLAFRSFRVVRQNDERLWA